MPDARLSFLAPLQAPIHLMVGNHDDRAAFRRVFRPGGPASAEPISEAFERDGVRFLLLDSVLPGKAEGRLADDQLDWLETELAAHPDRPTWVFLHHQPLPIYIRWLDALGLQNTEGFLAFQFSSINQELAVTQEPPGFRRVEIRDGERRHWLHFLDGRVVPEPAPSAIPIYVR